MPVCSYIVFPEPGRDRELARRLSRVDGCEVLPAENRPLLLLVTSTASPAEDRALRERLESERGIEALVLAFGEIDPDTEEADPVAAARSDRGDGRRRLPVLGGD